MDKLIRWELHRSLPMAYIISSNTLKDANSDWLFHAFDQLPAQRQNKNGMCHQYEDVNRDMAIRSQKENVCFPKNRNRDL